MRAIQNETAALMTSRQEAVSRGVVAAHQVFAARAEGTRVWDVDGREYLDFAAGIGVLNVGHNHPRVLAAVREQLDRFSHTCFQVLMYEPYVRLAERLARLIGAGQPTKAFLATTGAEAVENGIKLARAATGRSAIIAFEVPPLRRSPANGAQHIVDVIDGLGRVSFLREMSDVHLDLLSRDLGQRLVTEVNATIDGRAPSEVERQNGRP